MGRCTSNEKYIEFIKKLAISFCETTERYTTSLFNRVSPSAVTIIPGMGNINNIRPVSAVRSYSVTDNMRGDIILSRAMKYYQS